MPVLLKLLPPKTRFVEPCCGEGDLIEQLCAAALLDASVEVKVELDKLAAVDRRKRNGNGGGRAAG